MSTLSSSNSCRDFLSVRRPALCGWQPKCWGIGGGGCGWEQGGGGCRPLQLWNWLFNCSRAQTLAELRVVTGAASRHLKRRVRVQRHFQIKRRVNWFKVSKRKRFKNNNKLILNTDTFSGTLAPIIKYYSFAILSNFFIIMRDVIIIKWSIL